MARLRGACSEVVDDVEACSRSARDWWPIAAVWTARGVEQPIAGAVARPASTAEVSAILRLASAERLPVTVAAGRSGVCGGSVPIFGGLVLDLTGLAGISDWDDASLLVEVAAGTFGDRLEDELRQSHGATLGHWPQSMSISTVGGWLACRSAGQYSTRYGKIEQMVRGMEVVLADGTVLRSGARAPRAANGPDLSGLFVGSEGTLGVITSALLQAWPAPRCEWREAWVLPSFESGLDACRRILRRGATPAVLRLYDEAESKRHFDRADGCVLLVLDEGEQALIDATASIVGAELGEGTVAGEQLVRRWLDHRNEVADLSELAASGIVADTAEVAASWSALPKVYREATERVRALDRTLAVSAHQSHAYPDGACLYFTFAGRYDNPDDAESYYLSAWEAIATATLDHGGALSHHHGVGLNRGRFMARALGSAMPVLQAVKDTLDPLGILNPGKLGLRSPFGPPPWP